MLRRGTPSGAPIGFRLISQSENENKNYRVVANERYEDFARAMQEELRGRLRRDLWQGPDIQAFAKIAAVVDGAGATAGAG